MALSNLRAGDSLGISSTYRFNSSQSDRTVRVLGMQSNSNTVIVFSVNLEPRSYRCELSGDNSKVLITMTGASNNPAPQGFQVDIGMDITRVSGGGTVLVVQVIPQGSSTGTTYTFTKSTGGGIEA